MALARSPGKMLLVVFASTHLPRAASHRRKDRMKEKVRSYLVMRLKQQQWGRHLRCVLQKAAMALLQPQGCSSQVLVAIWSLWLRRDLKSWERFCSLTHGSKLLVTVLFLSEHAG